MIGRQELWHRLGHPRGAEAAWLGLGVAQTLDGTECLPARIVVAGGDIPATFLRPAGAAPGPAILYCHAHGNHHDIGKAELTGGRPALLDPPPGLWLARRGYRVLCPDMPGFGARQAMGPEPALAKAALWQGRCLLGDMLAELAAARAALAARPEVTQVGTFGLSMGATLAYWLAALDQGVAFAAHFCAFANMAPLIASGAHDLHGPYMTVPGLLPGADMGDVAALIAPRPQLVCSGADDPLTPPAALNPALARLRAAYAGSEGRLSILTAPHSGHTETPAMRAALAAHLEAFLPAGTDQGSRSASRDL